MSASTIDSAPDLNQLGIWDLSLFDPQAGYQVDNTTVLDYWPEGETGGLTFGEGGDPTDKRVYIVRDSQDYDSDSEKVWKKYTDYIGVKRKSAGTITGKWYRFSTPLTTFINGFDPATNTSEVSFYMSGTNDSIVLELVDNNTERISWNNYTIYLGKSIFQEGKVGLWNSIKMVMWGEIPGFDPMMNMALKILLNFTLVFVLFVMISRVIPFLPGS